MAKDIFNTDIGGGVTLTFKIVPLLMGQNYHGYIQTINKIGPLQLLELIYPMQLCSICAELPQRIY